MPSVTRPFYKTRDPFLKTPKKSSAPGYIFLKKLMVVLCANEPSVFLRNVGIFSGNCTCRKVFKPDMFSEVLRTRIHFVHC